MILHTLDLGLGLSAGVGGLLVSYRAATCSGGGLDQLVADPEPQQLPFDVDITAGPGVVAALRCEIDNPSLMTANTA